MTLAVIALASLMGSVLGLATIGVVYVKRKGRYVRKLGTEAGPKRARKAAIVAYRFLPMPFGVSLGTVAIVAIFLGEYAIRRYLGVA